VRLPLLIVSLCVLALAGCGDDEPRTSTKPQRVVLALDFTPNAVHAPIYAAKDSGADRDNGVELEIRTPGSGPDSLKLVASGKADIGILDIHDLAIARQQNADIVGVAALVQKPLAAIIALPKVKRPRDLEGRTVGVSGLPSDPAFLDAVMSHDGGDLGKVKQVTIGFEAVSRLLTKRVDAVPAFWNAEGVALEHRGLDVNQFRVEDYGAPPYPEVVVMTSRRTLHNKRAAIEKTLAALKAGIEETQADPERVAAVIARAAGTDDVALIEEQLDAVLPLFTPPLRLDREVLERWADFDVASGLVKRRPDVGRAFEFRAVP
jgi:putative hydroxymethylpyrimidine transport system substrate-binding protein